MRAVVVARPGADEPLDLVELPDPGQPAAGEVRVRVHASSINYQDGSVIASPNTPVGHVPLADAAGTVEAVGANVTRLRAGELVIGRFFPGWIDGPPPADAFGAAPGIGAPGYARDVVVAPAEQFDRAPAGWSAEQAATLPVAGVTAWRAVVDVGRAKPGDVVLVLGTGGVSLFALQFAKALGATVVVTSSSDAKLERARALGADVTINYRATPQWGTRVHELTGGADIVVEVGGPATLPQSVPAARPGATVVLVGTLTGFAGDVPTGLLTMKQASVTGVVVGSHRHQHDLVRALDGSTLRPVVDRTFDLTELGDAARYARGATRFGKTVIHF